MLKFVNSGLSQSEVRRAQIQDANVTVAVSAWQVLLPLVAGAGALAMLAELAWGIIAFVIVSVLGGMLTIGASVQLFNGMKHMNNADQNVRVIRAGLLRRVRVGDLVAGDVVVLASGAIVPVDVLIEDRLVSAGTKTHEQVTAVVQATGANRLQAQQLATAGRSMTLHDVFEIVRLTVIKACQVVELPRFARLVQRFAVRMQLIASAVILNVRALVGMMTQLLSRRRMINFVYNQGPVSWSTLQH